MRWHFLYQVRCLICDAHWAVTVLFNGWRGEQGGNLSLSAQKERPRAYLRKTLQSVPYWWRGYLALGFLELSLHEQHAKKPSPRLLASVRAGALAVIELAKTFSVREIELLQAEALLAGVDFLTECYETAEQRFKKIIKTPCSKDFPPQWRNFVLENAGASALALGEDSLAIEYFNKIPDQARTPQVHEVVNFLKKRPTL